MVEKICRYCGSSNTKTVRAQPEVYCKECGRGLGYYEYAREWQIDDKDEWLFDKDNH